MSPRSPRDDDSDSEQEPMNEEEVPDKAPDMHMLHITVYRILYRRGGKRERERKKKNSIL